MTHDTKERHQLLHNHLDELIACYIAQTHRLPSETTLMEFMKWSHEMTTNPTCADDAQRTNLISTP